MLAKLTKLSFHAVTVGFTDLPSDYCNECNMSCIRV